MQELTLKLLHILSTCRPIIQRYQEGDEGQYYYRNLVHFPNNTSEFHLDYFIPNELPHLISVFIRFESNTKELIDIAVMIPGARIHPYRLHNRTDFRVEVFWFSVYKLLWKGSPFFYGDILSEIVADIRHHVPTGKH